MPSYKPSMVTNLAILFGGKSCEHEVSVTSAKSILKNINPRKYNVIPILINKNQSWSLLNEHLEVIETFNFFCACQKLLSNVDIVFPILHGINGEDGTIQGMLEVCNIPYVGEDVMTSSLCMDKDISKKALNGANIPTAEFLTFYSPPSFDEVYKQFGTPLFVKPANSGSSVGITKVNNEPEFDEAVRYAFLFDKKILVEKAIVGREFECAVLGGTTTLVSQPAEIFSCGEVYSYEKKYLLNANNTKITLPANIPDSQALRLMQMSEDVFRMLSCSSMARIDFFIDHQDNILVNEINTIPGFAPSSLYPKLMEFSGISIHELIERLLDIAIIQFNKKHKRCYDYTPALV